jgi:hypothetical protein
MTRPLGALNRISRDLKEGMLYAASVGSDYAKDSEDPNAPPRLNRYLTTFCNKHPEIFFQALMKLIPKETHLQQQSTIDVTYSSLQQVREAMLENGMSPKLIAAIESQLLPVSVNNEKPVHNNETVDISHFMRPENDSDEETNT